MPSGVEVLESTSQAELCLPSLTVVMRPEPPKSLGFRPEVPAAPPALLAWSGAH